MAGERDDWREQRNYVINALTEIKEGIASLNAKHDTMVAERSDSDILMNGRMCALEERVKWIAIGASTVISLIVSAAVGVITTFGKSIMSALFMKVG